jgi:hypothetical protein
MIHKIKFFKSMHMLPFKSNVIVVFKYFDFLKFQQFNIIIICWSLCSCIGKFVFLALISKFEMSLQTKTS